ncbi:2-oxoglutarate oxidoreductase [bacterium (Candidatus Blackallbacteria) CG17_big_fil_post_rev_8_21_14_2_50_48_46]|uniref:2-oxoglutarate oxidoreductase n=1 Tax=bacterium (Candidatus Blackallbacteria) CG17_big_fil_post_rev_8_21_14_2_50_48_46 TaxID=2014261 RepID=A0A2M7G3G8_9BACT|nr:MAG: 2-oxoglutarate oxidoreductase [bacterium (Candidatus Blackallbacteria) CG18_big_fil_WC_8_21_14_2_50_49_26]PIW16327.1 MAG: 2-oxoglutarate oxidoreductase [bacterium (Candidatus Blackallbacteria) CG17_big_fil_post_rev_8_21_14_2_50_48_46]PIW45341.1 MAG: 2-oxoglutarate oxidoreductase [bacterium (Candidatus Blackallbacteria) CG13_big_fil_rev_8_21_14_2_50_49_14]
MSEFETPYCPGCSHSHLQGLLAEIFSIETWKDRLVGVVGPGCSQDLGTHFRIPIISSPPGMAPAVAAGMKRTSPDRLVFTYQGEGDLGSRGLDALMHAALRGDSITVICLNNQVMAGSGGQMSVSSRPGQITTSTRLGRSTARSGKALRLAEMVARLPGVAFSQRVALHTPDFVKRTRLALREAFHFQENGQGLAFIEVMGMCPPYWHETPEEARLTLDKTLLKHAPAGIFRSVTLIR